MIMMMKNVIRWWCELFPRRDHQYVMKMNEMLLIITMIMWYVYIVIALCENHDSDVGLMIDYQHDYLKGL